ncbi:MAG: hypothetical protein AAFX40_09670, partial [Cyanobacteria bacterium J06639_1]
MRAPSGGGAFGFSTEARGGFDSNVVGSVANNQLDNTTEAFLRGADVSVTRDEDAVVPLPTGNVELSATDSSKVFGLGGAFGLGSSTVASGSNASAIFGFAVALNDAHNTVRTYIDSSTLLAETVDANALSEIEVWAIAVGGTLANNTTPAGSAVSISGAGAGSNNQIESEIESTISGDSIVNASDGVELTAIDDSDIRATSGGFGFAIADGQKGSGTLSVGASASVNEIDSDVRAFIDDSAVTTAGNVTLEAASTAKIKALSMGGSISFGKSASGLGGAFAGAGAGSGNDIRNTIEATIQNDAIVTTTGGSTSVALSATDDATIVAD